MGKLDTVTDYYHTSNATPNVGKGIGGRNNITVRGNNIIDGLRTLVASKNIL